MRTEKTLPIEALLPQILALFAPGGAPNLLLEAAPGAGKTTQVPRALLGAVPGEILVLEPRRMAARMAARRVAEELGEPVGETVGYQVRFEQRVGPRTRLRFLTEGVLTRRLLTDPDLTGVSLVVLDEFHERHLEGDLALALLRRLQQRRAEQSQPPLRLLVMSATLETEPVARFLGDCPVLTSPGRQFPLTITHLSDSAAPLEALVARAVEQLLREGVTGDLLAFLPGAAEIRRAQRACEEPARRAGLLVLPLHGSLSPEEQDRAVAPARQQKLILATNVAESSITIDGVTAVIDSGLARIANWSPWRGMPMLEVARISKASATQRAGRAGRTAAGRVIRLYRPEDLDLRPEHDTPEMLRADLSQLCLTLRSMGIEYGKEPGRDLEAEQSKESSRPLEWLTAPPAPSVAAAEELLDRLGAHGSIAEQMARLPLPPRLARMLLAAEARGVGEAACWAAALLNAAPNVSAAPGGSGNRSGSAALDHPDLLHALDALHQMPASAQPAGVRQQSEQLLRILRGLPKAGKSAEASQTNNKGANRELSSREREEALLQALLTGFADRVAKRRSGNQLLLASGGSAEVQGEWPAAVGEEPFLLMLDVEERSDKPLPLVRRTARIKPEWLIDQFPERIGERVGEHVDLAWNPRAERVEAVSRLLYDELTLTESRDFHPQGEAVSALLAEQAVAAGLTRFIPAEELAQLTARVAFAQAESPKLKTEAAEPARPEADLAASVLLDFAQALGPMCLGLSSFAELAAEAKNLLPQLERSLVKGRLAELAPTRLRLKAGREVRVHYEEGKPPWIASRLQDFFGMEETPRLGPRRVPVVVHLLGPNQRPLQMTADLKGFWERLYPQIRRELMRRYPRHSWPEKP